VKGLCCERFVGCERTFGCPQSDAYLHTEVHDRCEVSYTPGLKLFIVHLSTDGQKLDKLLHICGLQVEASQPGRMDGGYTATSIRPGG
jgi:hypothetical protein